MSRSKHFNRWCVARRATTTPPGPSMFVRPPKQGISIGLLGRRKWPKIIIRAKAHGKMWALVQACPMEVSWFATARRTDSGNIVVDDIFVPGQECSLSRTVITEDGEAALLQWLIERGRLETINDLKCWGHSHGDMDVFSSGTDEHQTAVFLERYDDYFVRLIANRRGHLHAAFFMIDEEMVIHQPPLHTESFEQGQWEDWAKEQLERHVVQRRYGESQDEELEISGDGISREVVEGWYSAGLISPEECTRILSKIEQGADTVA